MASATHTLSCCDDGCLSFGSQPSKATGTAAAKTLLTLY
jgi:hypothetical protein